MPSLAVGSAQGLANALYSRCLAILFAVTLALAGERPALANDMPLLLEVRLNDRDTGLIVPFTRNAHGELSAQANELAGLRLPVGDARGAVPLSRIPGLVYRYHEANQSVAITIPARGLAVQALDVAQGPRIEAEDIVPGTGALLSYSVFLAGTANDKDPNDEDRNRALRYSGASVSLDGRLYGGLGELRQTLLASHDGRGTRGIRLDTTLTRIVPGKRLALTAGDAITGGLAWSRPVRFGGLQVQRNFTMRPDLVTLPLPSVSGTALVPSSLDLYINGTQSFSSRVSEGPFRIDNLPTVTGNGEARVVLRDLQGREIETVTPFFASNRLLRPGLSEYSVEIGVPRYGYGKRSFGYSGDPFVSMSGRLGLRGPITVEGHAEVASGLLLAGGGATIPVGRVGVIGGAAAGSVGHGVGGLVHASFESGFGAIRLNIESLRTFGDYSDLATLDAVREDFGRGRGSRAPPIPGDGLDLSRRRAFAAARPARATERISIGAPVPGIGGSLSLAYAYERRHAVEQRLDLGELGDAGERRGTVSASYSRTLFGAMSLNISGYGGLGRGSGLRRSGVFAGLSLPLGGRSNASIGFSRDAGRTATTIDLAHAADVEPGSVGWRLSASESERRFLNAAIDYRTRVATFRAQVTQNGGSRSGSLGVEGAVVVDRALFAAPRIERSFAIVDAGAPGVPVTYQNRPVGRSRKDGLLLVGDTRPFERNAIAIDLTRLPPDALAPQSVRTFRPAGPGGVRIDFVVRRPRDQAMLHLVDHLGVDMPVGAEVRINDGELQTLGFDGLALATGLKGRNVAKVRHRGRACQISFAFVPETAGTTMPRIGTLMCRTAADYAVADIGQTR